jgi:sterol 14-demethylase
MISALMQQSYRDGRPLHDEEMAHIMIALLMAGQHTSSTTSSWTLLHLAANPDIAYVYPALFFSKFLTHFLISDALYQEQINHFRSPDGKLRQMTYEDIRSLPLLDSVIRETLRMHPPIHSIMRYVRDDVPVPSSLSSPSEDGIYIVPKGNYVLASPAVCQVDRTVWKNADNWDPYRWNDTEGVAAQAYKADIDDGEKIDYGYGTVSKGTESPYQPFGAGRHRCVGEQVCRLLYLFGVESEIFAVCVSSVGHSHCGSHS